MRRLVTASTSICLIVVGAILFPLPVPFGLPLIVIGLALWVSTSAATARWMAMYRRRNPAVDGKIRFIQGYLPQLIRSALHITDPRCRVARQSRRSMRQKEKAKAP